MKPDVQEFLYWASHDFAREVAIRKLLCHRHVTGLAAYAVICRFGATSKQHPELLLVN